MYFVYGRLLLKCHDPESKPEEVMQLKKLLPEEEQPYYAEDNYYGHIVLTAYLFTDGDALYIFAQGDGTKSFGLTLWMAKQPQYYVRNLILMMLKA